MNKQQRIQEYNLVNKGYNITNIKKMNNETIEAYGKWGASSLNELYANPSNAKKASYKDIINTYNPEIISVQGSCHSYSVILRASNGDILHITKSNNYLIDITE